MQQLVFRTTLSIMRRVGLPRPSRLPLHPNRAHAPLTRPPSSIHSAARALPAPETTSSRAASTTLPTKRRHSSSPSPSPASPSPASPSLLRTSPSIHASGLAPSSSPIPWWQPESANSSHSLLDLARASPPPDPSVPLLTSLTDDTAPFYTVDAFVPPLLPAPQVPSPVSSPPSPRHWTLSEVIKQCTTWEEYQRRRPTGFSAMRESWAVVDAAMRKRHHKQPKEPWSVVFTRVHSNMKRSIESNPQATAEDGRR